MLIEPRQIRAFHPPQLLAHQIVGHSVNDAFRIQVWLPMRAAHERFPVLYATDADDLFGGLATLAHSLQLHAEAPRFILIGIGYENSAAAPVLRWRDLATHDIRQYVERELRDVAGTDLVSGLGDLDAVFHTTDAHGFARFIETELITFIDAQYPTLPGERSYFGYSAGATFGLITLFSRPELFQRYLLGSAASSYNGHSFMQPVIETYLAENSTLAAHVFMSVGALEDDKQALKQFQFVRSHTRLTEYLRAQAIEGLKLTTRIFADETHASAWAPAFSHGLRALFPDVDTVPFAPKYFTEPLD